MKKDHPRCKVGLEKSTNNYLEFSRKTKLLYDTGILKGKETTLAKKSTKNRKEKSYGIHNIKKINSKQGGESSTQVMSGQGIVCSDFDSKGSLRADYLPRCKFWLLFTLCPSTDLSIELQVNTNKGMITQTRKNNKNKNKSSLPYKFYD